MLRTFVIQSGRIPDTSFLVQNFFKARLLNDVIRCKVLPYIARVKRYLTLGQRLSLASPCLRLRPP